MKKIYAILLSVFVTSFAFGQATDFAVALRTAINPSPAVYPGTVSAEFRFTVAGTSSYTFSSDVMDNRFATMVISVTNVTGLTLANAPTGTGGALFNWSLVDNGNDTWSWVGHTKDVTITTVPSSYVITLSDHPVASANANIGSTSMRAEFTDPTTADVMPNNGTLSNNEYTGTTSRALPVKFGSVAATIKDGSLNVNWITESEKNNAHFVIEASKDGKNFVAIDSIATQAKDGNSETVLNYSYSKSLSSTVSVLGFEFSGIAAGIFALLIIASVIGAYKGRRQVGVWALLLVAGMAFLGSCRKDEQQVKVPDAVDIFVKVTQVDIDGTRASSTTVKAINE